MEKKNHLLLQLQQAFLGKEQRKWIKEQLQYASQNNLRVIFCMHHNLYAHNPAVNKGYVVDDYRELRKLLAQYNVKLVFLVIFMLKISCHRKIHVQQRKL